METPRLSPEPVIRIVAQTSRQAQLVEELHARAAAAASASRSVVLEVDAHRQHLRPTSGAEAGAARDEAWIELPSSVALVYEIMASGHPRQVVPLATVMPDLAFRLGTKAAIIAPIMSRGLALGVLVLGIEAVVPALEWIDQVAACADAFAVVLSHGRLERDVTVHQEIEALVLELARRGGGERDATQMERFCVGLSRTLNAERVTVWRHDRVGRRLAVVAASDGSHRRRPALASTADADALLVRALRGTEAELLDVPAPHGQVPSANAAVPLRGQRRALGVLVCQGLRLAPGDAGRVRERLTRVGQQLARVIEARQLLDDVVHARRELERTFDAMRDIVLVCDSHLRLLQINEAGLQRTGLARRDLPGRPVTGVVGEGFGRWLSALPLDAPGEWPPHTTEVDDPVLRGTFVVTVTPLPDDSGGPAGLVIAARDVTEERRLEAERSALRDQLAKSEALSHLVAGIAHELNNPLQGVLGHVELLRRTAEVPSTIDATLRQVYREADRAGRIVRNLLLLAGSGRLALRSISVNAALAKALGRRSRVCRQLRIRVHRNLAAGLPRIKGDTILLQQAFLNILINAEQALSRTEAAAIEVRTWTSDGRVFAEVRDTGPGFEAEVAGRVFEPFFTTRDSGSGLGLALTQRIVREHRGEVSARNAPDGGAVFTVSLPVSAVVE